MKDVTKILLLIIGGIVTYIVIKKLQPTIIRAIGGTKALQQYCSQFNGMPLDKVPIECKMGGIYPP